MGLAYSMLASSLWPLVALIVPEYQLGTAYGMYVYLNSIRFVCSISMNFLVLLSFSCQSVQNLGLAVVSMFAGIIVDRGGYFTLEIFFICWLGGKFE